MATGPQPAPGTIGWDLTVPNAAVVRDFYSAVAGWRAEPVDMGDYSNFAMTSPATSAPVAGICYARGENADLPPQRLLYVLVSDIGAFAPVWSKRERPLRASRTAAKRSM
jgi:uncharacterized protein